MNEGPAQQPEIGSKKTRARRRGLRRMIVGALVLAILGLAISYAPRYIARHLLANELTALGIEHQGIDTLRLNPWTREAWIGPVRFSQGQAPPGELMELGVKIALTELFSRRALIERVMVRGLELRLTRAEDGGFSLNGIPLARFMGGSSAAEPTEDDAGWGAGLDVLELRDSRFVYDDRARGELVARIDRLGLDGFRTWAPDQAGGFALDARVNDIATRWTGQARPFADNITVTAKSRIDGANLPSIIEFTGSLGLDRREGVYNTDLDLDLTVFASGRIEGQARGTIEVLDADYARGEGFALTLERGDIRLDTRYALTEQNDLQLGGRLEIDARTGAASLAKEMRFALASGRAVFDELDAAFGADRSIRIETVPVIDVTDGSFTGRLQISVNQILDLLAYLQSLSTVEPSGARDTGLEDWSQEEVTLPTSDVKAASLKTSIGRFALVSAQGNVSLDLAADTEISSIRIGSGDRAIEVEGLTSLLEALSLRSGGGELRLELSGNNSLAGGTSTGPIGELSVGGFDSDIERFALVTQSGRLNLEISSSAEAAQLAGTVYEEEYLPETGFELGSVSASLSGAEATIGPGSVEWRASGGARVGGISVAVAKGEKARVALEGLVLTKASADHSLSATGESLTISGLDAFLTRSFLEALRQPEGEEGPGGSRTAPQEDELVREIQRLLAELGFDPGPADGAMGRRTRAAIQAFQKAQGLTVDTEASQALLADLRAVAAGEPPPGRTEPLELPRLTLDRFALEGAKVRFLDDTVEPRVDIVTVFEKAGVEDFDTNDPSTRTKLDVAATVNEFTRIELKGWTSALGVEPSLDATARIENLQLPTFSPYAVQLAGMYLESGQLTTTTSATAEQGELDGLIELDMLDVDLEPLSEADAERLAGETGGLPIGTVVALLQDSSGRIELSLPLGGTVANPEVDISSAITKAIAGAFKSVFRAFGGGGKGLDFEPVVFAPGSAELTSQGKADADDLVSLLESRPKLSLDVCGRATARDLEALEQASPETVSAAESGKKEQPDAAQPPGADEISTRLTELARERTGALRRYLVTERGIDAARLGECRAAYDAGDEGPPRAEIKL